jgi:hypothetical protein
MAEAFGAAAGVVAGGGAVRQPARDRLARMAKTMDDRVLRIRISLTEPGIIGGEFQENLLKSTALLLI